MVTCSAVYQYSLHTFPSCSYRYACRNLHRCLNSESALVFDKVTGNWISKLQCARFTKQYVFETHNEMIFGVMLTIHTELACQGYSEWAVVPCN